MEAKANYANINGLKMYYEIHGEGQPLVLLHGALSATGTSFGKVLPGLSKVRQVIAVELQAHGHTADIDRPLSVPAMAGDVAELLRQLNLSRADVLGYSMGAGVALELTQKHSELVRKAVLVSGTFNDQGFHPGFLEGMSQIQPEFLQGTPWQQEYAQIAPNPENFTALVEKVKKMEMAALTADEIKAMTVPVLIMIGDSDIVMPEHAVEMFRLLGGGVMGDTAGMPASQLAILPGVPHSSIMENAELIVPMVSRFLDAPAPPTA